MIIFPYQKDIREDFYPTEELNLTINTGKPVYLGGVGGRIRGYIHNLKLKIAGKTLIAPVIFSYEYTVSLNLLGRAGVFQNFKITFDEKNLVVKVQ